jgi:hypothetical protein
MKCSHCSLNLIAGIFLKYIFSILAPKEEPGCKSDSECPSTQTCINRQCLNVCTVSNPCARNAECFPENHRANCKCPSNLKGDPFINCYQQQAVVEPECTLDSQCNSNKACISQTCQDPCIVSNRCGIEAICRAEQHRAVCHCPDGWGGNPQTRCYKRKLKYAYAPFIK